MGWTKPKCLLEVGGATLLARMLDAVRAAGVRDVVIVVGYERSSVEAEARRSGLNCTFVANDDYDSTNTIHSLWLARDLVGGDFLYFNADILFAPDIVTLLLAKRGNRLAIDVKPCGDEEVKVVVDDDDRIRKIGKKLPPDACAGEFIGIARFVRDTVQGLFDALRRYNEDLGRRNLFFEAALDDMAAEHELRAVRIGDRPAIEIDTPEDFRQARALWDRGAFTAKP